LNGIFQGVTRAVAGGCAGFGEVWSPYFMSHIHNSTNVVATTPRGGRVDLCMSHMNKPTQDLWIQPPNRPPAPAETPSLSPLTHPSKMQLFRREAPTAPPGEPAISARVGRHVVREDLESLPHLGAVALRQIRLVDGDAHRPRPGVAGGAVDLEADVARGQAVEPRSSRYAVGSPQNCMRNRRIRSSAGARSPSGYSGRRTSSTATCS
jgi:hypothetical protein